MYWISTGCQATDAGPGAAGANPGRMSDLAKATGCRPAGRPGWRMISSRVVSCTLGYRSPALTAIGLWIKYLIDNRQ